MNKIPSQIKNPKGLHQRYYIQKINYNGYFEEGEALVDNLMPVDKDAEYFVMRLDEGGSDIEHIKACRIGIHAYAKAIQHHLPELAKDLIERYPLIGEETEGQDELWQEVVVIAANEKHLTTAVNKLKSKYILTIKA
jgi:hypothetical protein